MKTRFDVVLCLMIVLVSAGFACGVACADVLAPPATGSGGAALGDAFSLETQDANQNTCDKNPQEGGPEDPGDLLQRPLSLVADEPRLTDTDDPSRATPATTSPPQIPREQFPNLDNPPRQPSIVPEPATLAVLGFGACGVVGLLWWRRRGHKTNE